MGGDLFERLHVPSPGNTSLAIAKWLRFEHRTRWICCCGVDGISLHLPPVEAESHPPSSRNLIVVRLRLLLPLQPVGVCSRKCGLVLRTIDSAAIDHRICLVAGSPIRWGQTRAITHLVSSRSRNSSRSILGED